VGTDRLGIDVLFGRVVGEEGSAGGVADAARRDGGKRTFRREDSEVAVQAHRHVSIGLQRPQRRWGGRTDRSYDPRDMIR
jgi:hypothetical protein